MIKLLATCFYIGYLPIAPGTFASLAALPFYYFFRNNNVLYLCFTIVSLILGFWISGKAERQFHVKDPKQIVIDEFSSQLLVFVFIPFNLRNLVIGFTLFRILDILKLPPVKKIQELPREHGIMLDDVSVAIFVNILLQVLRLS